MLPRQALRCLRSLRLLPLHHHRCASSGTAPVIGIKRETVNLWEQRSPLTPAQVQQCIHAHGVKVLVQPSNRRCFTGSEYEAVGAEVRENLEEAQVILGVKRPTELRPQDLLPNKTYVFFTHTIKAQEDNMALLDTLLERNIRIIDYECMVNEANQRVVAFGKFAGMAGTLDILHGLGIRLLAMGHKTPFIHIAITHSYRNLSSALQAVQLAGYDIARGQLPASIGPLIFVIHGDGNVAQGAESILRHLPINYVKPSELKEIADHGSNQIYLCKVGVADYMVNKEGTPFSMEHYMQHPQEYKSTFNDKIAPYTSVLINSTYWDSRIDRILTRENVKPLVNVKPNVDGCPRDEAHPTLPYRLLAICDISADRRGSIEFTEEFTTIDDPFVIYDPISGTEKKKICADGILMCSIDNMPAQLPYEATEYFGTSLMPYMSDLIRSDATKPFEEFEAAPAVKNAIITSNGKLTPRFQYIDVLRQSRRFPCSSHRKSKRALILGAGYVVPPVIEYLSRDKSIEITVVSNVADELDAIAKEHPNIQTRNVNVLEDSGSLSELVKQNDLVLSLIPWKFHPTVVAECVKEKRNLLTASYCTPVLKEMENSIRQAGITAFMEIGLDPGIDHLLTKECIDEVQAKGGTVVSYRSFTGGLPAPENSNNPLRYKFSWSPEAAMSTVMNGAKYLEDGQVKEIPADGSLMKMAAPMDVFPGFNLEGYPNRDSTRYIDLYGLKDCQTVIRGTMRYRGYADAILFMLELGLLQANPEKHLQPGSEQLSWRQLICRKLGLDDHLTGKELHTTVFGKLAGNWAKYQCLNSLGFLSEDPVVQANTPLSSTSVQLAKHLTYGPEERDLIVMAHELLIDWPDQGQREQRNVSLVAYGDAGKGKAGLAMSKTVGIPAAIAAKMMLDGEITEKGIVLPLKPEIYKPILKKLKSEGINAQEISTYYDLP